MFGKDKDNDQKKKKDGADEEKGNSTGDEAVTEKRVEKAQADRDGYQVFKMPWSLNVNYSFRISEDRSKPINRNTMRYPFKYTQISTCRVT